MSFEVVYIRISIKAAVCGSLRRQILKPLTCRSKLSLLLLYGLELCSARTLLLRTTGLLLGSALGRSALLGSLLLHGRSALGRPALLRSLLLGSLLRSALIIEIVGV